MTTALAVGGCGGNQSSNGPATLSLQLFGPTQQLIHWLSSSALPEFTKKHGAKVEIRQTDWQSSFQKMLTGAASGTLADVTMMGQVQTAALAAKHAFLPLDDYVKNWPDRSNFYPNMFKNGVYKGHQYAIPFIADTRTPHYRVDILKKAHTSSNQLPTDWDAYAHLAQAVKTNAPKVAAPAFWGQDKTGLGLMQSFSQLLYQAGGTFFDASGHSNLSSDAGVSALTYMVSFFKKGLSNAGMIDNGSGASPLTQGAAAMTFTGYSAKQNAEQFDPSVTKQIVAGVPLASRPGGAPKTIGWINKFGISRRTKHADQAWALLSFLVAKENAAKLDQYLGGLSARTDLNSGEFLKDVTPAMADASKYAGALPQNPDFLEVQQKVGVAIQQAVRLQGTPTTILNSLDKTIDSIVQP